MLPTNRGAIIHFGKWTSSSIYFFQKHLLALKMITMTVPEVVMTQKKIYLPKKHRKINGHKGFLKSI